MQIQPKQIVITPNGGIIYSDGTGHTVVLPPGASQFVLSIVAGLPAYVSTQDLPVNALEVFKYSLFNIGLG